MPCESLVRTHCRRYVRTRAPKVVVPDATVASTPRPGLGAASRHTEPALDWSTPDREATQQCGCVVALGTRARTQNGHIRNDTRDVPRRISSACNSAIRRKKYVASDRACARVMLQNFHGKEGGRRFESVRGLCKIPVKRGFFVSVQSAGTRSAAANEPVWSAPRRRRSWMVIGRGLWVCCCGSMTWWRRTSGLRRGLPSSSVV